MLKTVGSGQEQYNNTFDTNGQMNNSGYPAASGALRGLQGQVAGRRKMRTAQRNNTRKRKGGFWNQVINQAIVPFSILGLQQSYKSKKR
jgi:hypothetical protein